MEPTPLVIATGNKGKLKEFIKILGETQYQFLTLGDIGFSDPIVEDGSTFEENARIKARVVATFLQAQGKHWTVLADDSGLEVDALGGAPGIYTARYAGEKASDADNIQKLLSELQGNSQRKARFVCALCWHSSTEEKVFHGECPGTILTAPKGSEGFGYDPIFEPNGHTRSFAEMTHDEKKSMSHRGFALQELKKWLSKT